MMLQVQPEDAGVLRAVHHHSLVPDHADRQRGLHSGQLSQHAAAHHTQVRSMYRLLAPHTELGCLRLKNKFKKYQVNP